MKKYLVLALIAVSALIGFTAVDVLADESDNAYVIVRCTITISVDVLDGNATFYVSGMSTGSLSGFTPGATEYSKPNMVSINNNSSGALTKWTLHVSTIQTKAYSGSGNDPTEILGTGWAADPVDIAPYTGWLLGDQSGVLTCALAAVFIANDEQAIARDFDPLQDSTAGDLLTMRTTANALDTWDTTARFFPDIGTSYPSRIGTSAANWTMPGDTCDLAFKFSAPIVVADENWRRIVVVVTAGQ
ncbi:MAG: hypothetical protein ABII64_08450 [Elusimicrobiota bacterium]